MRDLVESPDNPGLLLPIYPSDREMASYTNRTIKEFDMDYVFQDTLTLDTAWKGRSAVHFVFKGTHCKHYNMFLSDFTELVRTNTLVNGEIDGDWRFVKKGKSFGVRKV